MKRYIIFACAVLAWLYGLRSGNLLSSANWIVLVAALLPVSATGKKYKKEMFNSVIYIMIFNIALYLGSLVYYGFDITRQLSNYISGVSIPVIYGILVHTCISSMLKEDEASTDKSAVLDNLRIVEAKTSIIFAVTLCASVGIFYLYRDSIFGLYLLIPTAFIIVSNILVGILTHKFKKKRLAEVGVKELSSN